MFTRKYHYSNIILFSLSILILLPLLKSFGQGKNKKYEAIDLAPFENSRHHWYDITAEDNVIEPKKNQLCFKPEQITEIADNILLYQKDNGGWAKNYDMTAILTDAQKDSLTRAKNILNTTYDNWTTHTQVEYLAQVFYQTKIKKYKDACLKGIDYILASQYPNGGWPQYFPDTIGYAKYITFNDGVFPGIMLVLKKIIDENIFYSFVDSERMEKIKIAYKKGLDCILKSQIKSKGKLTVWCQQHDNIDLHPQWARAYEPPSICNGESAEVILFLMSIDNPSEEIKNSIQCAVKWFEDSKIPGIRIGIKRITPIKYKWSTIGFDRFVVEDSTAPPIWTRYYEIDTDRPLFCNRDSKVVYYLAEVLHERRAGYSWYTYDPQRVLDNYSEWQNKWTPTNNVLDK